MSARRPAKPPPLPIWRMLFRRPLPLEHETALFTGLSALDILLTWFLISGGRFREANPIAKFILDHWGIGRLIVFKFALVAFVALAAQVIALKRLTTARRLLQFASLVVAGVVVYGVWLFGRTEGWL